MIQQQRTQLLGQRVLRLQQVGLLAKVLRPVGLQVVLPLQLSIQVLVLPQRILHHGQQVKVLLLVGLQALALQLVLTQVLALLLRIRPHGPLVKAQQQALALVNQRPLAGQRVVLLRLVLTRLKVPLLFIQQLG